MHHVKYDQEARVLFQNLVHQGQALSVIDIYSIMTSHIPNFDSQFFQPSDHCINVSNKGACNCSLQYNALFEKISRGLYKVR